MKNNKVHKLQSILVTCVLSLCALLVVLPMYLTVITSFKTPSESSKSFFNLPQQLYWGNFQSVLSTDGYFQYITNSVVITFFSLAAIVLLVPMVSYAISRNAKHPYFKALYGYLLIGIFVPFQVIMLPLVKFLNGMNLCNQFGIIIMYVTLSFAQGAFLAVGYLKSIPLEIEEAAHIDGCSTFQTFWRIVYPLMKPIVITILIIDVLWVWNDFMLPLVLLNKSNAYWTLPLFQFNFKSQYAFDYNLAFAAFFLSMLPIIIAYAFLQKHIMGGLTDGAIKS